jgi:DNA mismatch repair protein MutS2
VLRRAKEALHGKEASMEDIIGELQEKRTSIERENERLERMREETERMRSEYEARRRELAEKQDRLIAEADKKALGIVENAEVSAKSLIKSIEPEARGAAMRKLERTKKHFGLIKGQVDKRDDERLTRRFAPDEKPLSPGDEVVVAGTATVGTLESLSGEKATITAGAARLELPVKMLRRATKEESKKERKAGGLRQPAPSPRAGAVRVNVTPPPSPVGVPGSVMVRGMTLDEAMPIVGQYLDRAYRAGYGEVSVIHGRGEGILRREVQMLCKNLPYVENFRLGESGEGGYGVTIVRFRR